VLKSDTKALMTAASQAEKAYRHLRQYSEEVVAVAKVA